MWPWFKGLRHISVENLWSFYTRRKVRHLREVILHIGAHKTGSTSIQFALAQFDSGVDFCPDICGYINHSIPIYTIFSKYRFSYHIHARQGLQAHDILKLKKSYLRSLHAALIRHDRERLILSGEDISLLDSEEKKRLVRFLERYGVTVRVIMYVREPLAFCASAFQEMVKHGTNEVGPISPSYRTRIEPFLQYLGEEYIEVRQFEPDALVDGDIVSDFCAFYGISITGGQRTLANASISEAALKLLFHFNSLPVLADGNHNRLLAFQELDNSLRLIYSGEKIDKNAFIDLVDFPESEKLFLFEKFGISYDVPQKRDGTPSFADYIAEMSGIDHAPLDQALIQRGISIGLGGSLADKLICLYDSFLSDEDRDEMRAEQDRAFAHSAVPS